MFIYSRFLINIKRAILILQTTILSINDWWYRNFKICLKIAVFSAINSDVTVLRNLLRGSCQKTGPLSKNGKSRPDHFSILSNSLSNMYVTLRSFIFIWQYVINIWTCRYVYMFFQTVRKYEWHIFCYDNICMRHSFILFYYVVLMSYGLNTNL